MKKLLNRLKNLFRKKKTDIGTTDNGPRYVPTITENAYEPKRIRVVQTIKDSDFENVPIDVLERKMAIVLANEILKNDELYTLNVRRSHICCHRIIELDLIVLKPKYYEQHS